MIRSWALGALALGLAVAGCSAEDAGHDAAEAPAGPSTLQPVAGRAPGGTTRVTCAVESASGPVRLAVDLPTAFRPARRGGKGCTWRDRVPMHDSDIAYSIDVLVSVAPATDSLEDVHAREEPFLVEGATPEGDDSVLDLVLQQDIPALGATIGDRVSWRCFCDGQDLITRMAQADGVRVTWSSVVSLTDETDVAFDRAVGGAGTV